MKLSQHNLAWPVSILLLSLLIIGMLLLNPAVPTAAPMLKRQTCDPSDAQSYPICSTQTAAVRAQTSSAYPNDRRDVCGPSNTSAYPACVTQTAAAFVKTSTSTSTSTSTPDSSNGNSTSTSQADTDSTPTLTHTHTPTLAEAGAENPETGEEDLDAPTDTPAILYEQPTNTPTNTLVPVSDRLTCIPGVPLRIEGQTTPRTALLLYFNGRAVGGATSSIQGLYSIQLVVGDEKSGDYLLEIQVRGTREVVDKWHCRVPGASDTPTPTEMGEMGAP